MPLCFTNSSSCIRESSLCIHNAICLPQSLAAAAVVGRGRNQSDEWCEVRHHFDDAHVMRGSCGFVFSKFAWIVRLSKFGWWWFPEMNCCLVDLHLFYFFSISLPLMDGFFSWTEISWLVVQVGRQTRCPGIAALSGRRWRSSSFGLEAKLFINFASFI